MPNTQWMCLLFYFAFQDRFQRNILCLLLCVSCFSDWYHREVCLMTMTCFMFVLSFIVHSVHSACTLSAGVEFELIGSLHLDHISAVLKLVRFVDLASFGVISFRFWDPETQCLMLHSVQLFIWGGKCTSVFEHARRTEYIWLIISVFAFSRGSAEIMHSRVSHVRPLCWHQTSHH